MAFHSKLKDRRGKVVSDLRLLGIVPHAHTNVIPTGIAPDVVGHFKPDRERESRIGSTLKSRSCCLTE